MRLSLTLGLAVELRIQVMKLNFVFVFKFQFFKKTPLFHSNFSFFLIQKIFFLFEFNFLI